MHSELDFCYDFFFYPQPLYYSGVLNFILFWGTFRIWRRHTKAFTWPNTINQDVLVYYISNFYFQFNFYLVRIYYVRICVCPYVCVHVCTRILYIACVWKAKDRLWSHFFTSILVWFTGMKLKFLSHSIISAYVYCVIFVCIYVCACLDVWV